MLITLNVVCVLPQQDTTMGLTDLEAAFALQIKSPIESDPCGERLAPSELGRRFLNDVMATFLD